MRKLILLMLMISSPALAHIGACLPSEVGTSVTVCDLGNHTKCVPTVSLAGKQRVGWIIGRCQGEPAPCTPATCAPDYTVCCQYPGHTQTAGSIDECPKTLFGSCLSGVAEAAEADPKGTTCVPNSTDTPTRSPIVAGTLLGTNVMRNRIVGDTTIPLDCAQPNTVVCCQYGPTGSITTTVDQSCDNCPDTLPGGAIISGCQPDAYASGDGQSCVSSN